jgi:hypothetical protein
MTIRARAAQTYPLQPNNGLRCSQSALPKQNAGGTTFVCEAKDPFMGFSRMKPLERLTKAHWEARPETLDWDSLKKYEPDQALQAFEQMRAVVALLVPCVSSVPDRLWLLRIAQNEQLEI